MIQATFRIVAPEGRREEILEVLSSLKEPAEVSKGCRGCSILQNADDDRVLTCLERWDTVADLEDHIRSERFRRLVPYIDISLEPPAVAFETVDKFQGMEFLVEVLTPKPS